MASFLSRSLLAAQVDLVELYEAVDNSKQMFTQRQRDLLHEAKMSAIHRLRRLSDWHGASSVSNEDTALFEREMTRRKKDRGITLARRAARRAKGEDQFVTG